MSKIIKVLAAGDSHGDKACPQSIKALLEYSKDFRPDIKIHLGDAFDFRALREGAGDSERNESVYDDLECGWELLSQYRPQVWLWGNHEHRINKLIESTGSALVRDRCVDIRDQMRAKAKAIGIKKLFPYHAENGIYEVGPVAFAHGYSHGQAAVTKQGAHYAQRGGGFVCGHIHRLEMVALEKWKGGAAYSAGCLCKKDEMSYASHRLASARWGNGFLAGWINVHTGDWKCWLIHKVGEQWVWQTDIKFFKPKL
jgi:predicted phosphodiesterase